MLSKLIVFSRLTKTFPLKFSWKPELSSLRFNSNNSPCGPPAKPLEGCGGGPSKANPCSGRANGGDSGPSKANPCSGRASGGDSKPSKANPCSALASGCDSKPSKANPCSGLASGGDSKPSKANPCSALASGGDSGPSKANPCSGLASGGDSKPSKANPCSGLASGGDSGGPIISSDKINYCEGRRGRKRTSLYTKDTLMMHCEVWPIIAIVSLEVIGIFFMIIWISQTRDEVKYFKKSKNHIESLDLLNPPKRKLYVETQQYKPMKELHEIYKAMKEGRIAMKEGRECKPTCKKPYCRFF